MPNKTIHSILIANRGEIASRVIRTCKKMGIRSIAVYSDADEKGLFVREADIAIHIGRSSPAESYLDGDKIIQIAKANGVDAIHPGYGFLSENAAFAKKCAQNGLIFIGPHADAIEAMGSKSRAKAIMRDNDVPVIPGYQGDNQRIETLVEAAKKVGFPLLLKATAGGGGKGMRIVHEAKDLEKNIAAAKRESLSAFGDDELIIEKYIAQGRHIEFQIFGDQHGNAIHILERECSIQRRYQKVLEESPSPVLDETLRQQMGNAAILAAKALHYDNAGTVEFIFDDKSKDFYFLEVNTRLQVEHPVTEAITGLDLVQMQIEVAEGHPLSLQQEDIKGKGYAIEARLYAEDASNNFNPSTGTVLHWDVPQVEGLRVETAVDSGSEISIHYDPMIAKIIVWDNNRRSAHRKMLYTLRHLKCQGLTTNQDFLLHLFEQEAINLGDYDTHYLDKHFKAEQLQQQSEEHRISAAIAITLLNWQQRQQKRSLLAAMPSGWRNSFYEAQKVTYIDGSQELLLEYIFQKENQFDFKIGTTSYAVKLIGIGQQISFSIDGILKQFSISRKGNQYFCHSPTTGNINLVEQARFPRKEAEKIKGGYESPMPSQIVKVLVEAGQKVEQGDALLIISSMKMENLIEAEEAGIVEEIYVESSQNVEAGYLLLKITSIQDKSLV